MLFLKLKQLRAYTLIEMLMVLSLVGLFATMSLAVYSTLIPSITADRVMMKLYRSLTFARIEAVRYNVDVSVCPIDSSRTTCGSDWSKGWMIFIDYAGDGAIHSDTPILQTIGLPTTGDTITWRGFRNKNYVQFTPMGFTNYLNGTFVYNAKNHDPALARTLSIQKNGAMRFSVGKGTS